MDHDLRAALRGYLAQITRCLAGVFGCVAATGAAVTPSSTPAPAPQWTPVPRPPPPPTGLKSVPCPSCGAGVGVPCHNRQGKPFLQDVHRSRRAAAGFRVPSSGAQHRRAKREREALASVSPPPPGLPGARRGRKPRLTLHPCPACGAPVGEPCRSASGAVSHSGHNARRRAAGLQPRLRTGGEGD